MAKSRRGVSDSIYTTLTFVSFAALAFGVGYVIYQSTELFGSWNPADAPKLGASILGSFFGCFFG